MKQKPLHVLTTRSNSTSPSLPLSSPQDGHLIPLTSWKDKYSSVECKAPASTLTQTGDWVESLSLSFQRLNKVFYPSSRISIEVFNKLKVFFLLLFFFYKVLYVKIT